MYPTQDARIDDPRVQALEAELADFSYIVSHDMMAKFRHVKGFAELLGQDLGADLSPASGGKLDRIRCAAEEGQAMLTELLQFSRIQQAPLELQSCDAAGLIDATRLQMGPQIRESGATFEVEPLGRVRIDPTLATEAFARVVDNAIKFRDRDRPLRIVVRRVRDSSRWAVQVCDNGPGVAPELREKLFRMFYRLEPNSGRPGVGAGLTICRRIFRRHGGEVQIVDCPDGLCVEFSLPLSAIDEP